MKILSVARVKPLALAMGSVKERVFDMSKLNNCFLSGFVSQEPKTKVSNGGWWSVSFSLNLLRVGSKEGQQKNDYANIKYLTQNQDKVESIQKGSRVEVVGEFRCERYEQNGEKKTFNHFLTFDVKVIEKGAAQAKPEDDEIDLDSLPF